MIRPRHLIIAALVGACIPIAALWLARVGAPSAVNSNEVAEVLKVAVSKPVQQALIDRQSAIYIKSESENILIEALQHEYSTLRILPWNQRPEDHGCEHNNTGLLRIAPCERGDFVSTSALVFPLWRTALVRISVFNGGGELSLIKIAGQWRILSQRWWYF